MNKIKKTITIMLSTALLVIYLPDHRFANDLILYEASTLQKFKSPEQYLEALNSVVDESVFPDSYPEFLKQIYILLRRMELLKQLPAYDREVILKGQQSEYENLFRGMLEDERLDVERLCSFARTQVGQNQFETFLKRFGIEDDKQEDMELEILAQIKRIRRREAYHYFVEDFENAIDSHAERVQLVKASMAPRELEYALRNCEEDEFQTFRDLVMAKDDFGPQTPQDNRLLDYLEKNRRLALEKGDKEASAKWQAVIAQMITQPVGREHGRLPFSKWELFAMMRNAERTLEQRKRPFIDITGTEELDEEASSYAYEIIKMMGIDVNSITRQQLIAYGFLDSSLAGELERLRQIYEDILSNAGSGQTKATRMSIRQKKELLEELGNAISRRIDTHLQGPNIPLLELVRKILEKRVEPYRLPFIRAFILLKGDEGRLICRFVEDFPMIVAGETYPYQWKHDNEVNIALLLANVDPYQAAQAVRFIIYYGMWRGEEAKKLGLYGWLPQIIFGDRQTGDLPKFDHRTYYYFPDFRFRPTMQIDEENERNRTSEIMQLPFFGWTVWRVYEELSKVNQEHGLAFLKEVYPYVRANTEAIRTALDPYNEAVLSGRDAWVNGMDNAWYHLMVMNRHLPERLIPEWATEIVEKNRVDNRIGKRPGSPVDPKLAEGRPSDYYYAFKIVFYNTINDLCLDPLAVYHASPYNAKDVAITSVMARSLESQIAMAKLLRNIDVDVNRMSSLRDRKDESVDSWDGEINRYQTYLDRMRKAVNMHLWVPKDKMYYNRDVTQMFPGVVEQQFCRITVDKENKIQYNPRMEYWNIDSEGKTGGRYVLNQKARESMTFEDYSVSMDLNGNIRYEYTFLPEYWKWVEVKDNIGPPRLNVRSSDPFIVEQFCHVKKDECGNIWYEPNLKYWTWVKDNAGNGHYELTETAKGLMGWGARKIEDGDLLRSPAIAGFFPLFGQIPTEEQAFELSMQVVNPWMWWPENGIPIPTQPMMVLGSGGNYISNDVYDPNKYWLGPTWMASTKPVIDGFHSYGYEMMHLYIVQLTVGTLADGRAVEHWRPETGEVNTSNVNFPWSASCMAGSIWPELSKEEQTEYLRRFRPPGYGEVHQIPPVRLSREPLPDCVYPGLYESIIKKKWGETLTTDKKNNPSVLLIQPDSMKRIPVMVSNQPLVMRFRANRR